MCLPREFHLFVFQVISARMRQNCVVDPVPAVEPRHENEFMSNLFVRVLQHQGEVRF
jgi:hypothetical protein